MLGGAYLCFEGFEKLAHKWLHGKAEDKARHKQLIEAVADPAVDIVAHEKDKIRGAIRTDFILSAEIIVITLGVVADKPFLTQLTVLAGVAVFMTIGVYGLVAGIVKLDDLGLYLARAGGQLRRAIGGLLVRAAPGMMKALSILGTAAMFLVGGGILTHGIPWAHHGIEQLAAHLGGVAGIGGVLRAGAPVVLNGVAGIVAGALVLLGVTYAGKAWRGMKGKAA
jgi:predicted DNA repair protein MutK